MDIDKLLAIDTESFEKMTGEQILALVDEHLPKTMPSSTPTQTVFNTKDFLASMPKRKATKTPVDTDAMMRMIEQARKIAGSQQQPPPDKDKP